MSLIRLDHVPETVKVNSPVNIILPDTGQIDEIPMQDRKVLYLLHGLSDDGSAWQRYSSIEVVARQYGLVVVMPSAGRSFYIDQPNGQAYFSYITEELPLYLQSLLGLSRERSHNLIAGNSMGGYGAIKAALLCPQQYFAAASFSGVLSLGIMSIHPEDARNEEFQLLFGDLKRLNGGPHDPAIWLRESAETRAELPHLYISCGNQDDLFPLQAMFATACQNLGIAITTNTEDAGHTWPFWDQEIRRFLKLVLDDENAKDGV